MSFGVSLNGVPGGDPANFFGPDLDVHDDELDVQLEKIGDVLGLEPLTPPNVKQEKQEVRVDVDPHSSRCDSVLTLLPERSCCRSSMSSNFHSRRSLRPEWTFMCTTNHQHPNLPPS